MRNAVFSGSWPLKTNSTKRQTGHRPAAIRAAPRIARPAQDSRPRACTQADARPSSADVHQYASATSEAGSREREHASHADLTSDAVRPARSGTQCRAGRRPAHAAIAHHVRCHPPRRLCASEARHRDGGGSKALDGPESRTNRRFRPARCRTKSRRKPTKTTHHTDERPAGRHPVER